MKELIIFQISDMTRDTVKVPIGSINTYQNRQAYPEEVDFVNQFSE